MTLGELFPDVGLPARAASRTVAGLAADSRAVVPDGVFFAVPGTRADGHGFLADALARGARAVVVAKRPANLGPDRAILVDDVRLALARAAARFHPRQPRTIVAVTGTSGKTSVAAFARQIFLALGHPAASLGTLGVVSPAGAAHGSLTTPDPIALHAMLDTLAGEGVTHVALEASSHGLEQRRLDGVRLSAAAFTNLSRDHLDYHATLDAYLEAKLRLLDLLGAGRPLVIDADAAVAGRLVGAAQARAIDVFGVGEAGQGIAIRAMTPHAEGTRLTLVHAGRQHRVDLPLIGRFMVSNALVAAGLALVTGGAPAAVFAALDKLEGAPGRLERVGQRHGAPILVDYAHKPDALEQVLTTLRPLTTGRLVVVLGCGGDRDAGKRPIMGAIAARLADVVIVTDDNPRSEPPAAIRAQILAAAPGAREIGDRATAIREAVAMLAAGDVLVVAGKGHETGQIVGDTTLPFSDQATVAAALEDLA